MASAAGPTHSSHNEGHVFCFTHLPPEGWKVVPPGEENNQTPRELFPDVVNLVHEAGRSSSTRGRALWAGRCSPDHSLKAETSFTSCQE